MSVVDEYIENEWFVVRHSGEMPEVAFHSSLYFLTEADEGPRLGLSAEQILPLKEAAALRYREIVLRDLQPENRQLTVYRGVRRSMINYRRYQQFCDRQQFEMSCFAGEVAAELLFFLVAEEVEVGKGIRQSVINCSFNELNQFAVEIGLVHDVLPEGIAYLCETES
jgi:hypothetical protein